MFLEILSPILAEQQNKLGYSHYGWAPLKTPQSIEFYEEWLKLGHHGEMTYLEKHLEQKRHPQQTFSPHKSILCFAFPYFTHPEPLENLSSSQLRISKYAQGKDYHFWLREKLQVLCLLIQEKIPQIKTLCITDSSPLLERDFAYEARLGWRGKNSCLIHPQTGSLFLIGEILIDLELPLMDATPVHDFCGNCRKCIEVCPTNAILENRSLEAKKCISYLTIESRKIPPLELREKIGDWFFGCDLCQTVCPWNIKAFQISAKQNEPLLADQNEFALEQELRWILTSSGKALERAFKASPLSRAGSFGLRRNALIVIGNRKIKNLTLEVTKYLEDEKLSELAQWTLSAIKS